MRKLGLCSFALAAALTLAAQPAFANANIVVVNTDGPGEGFNDPAPRAPEGGNPGTTLGEQRLRAFEEAARIWGETLDSAVTIRIQAAFNPLACSPTSGTLGSARALAIFGNFPGAPAANTWYHVALANRLAFGDLAPVGTVGLSSDDIAATFNSNLGLPGCLVGTDWYYGFDANEGVKFDLVAVLLHEFAHGLGFSSFVNKATGQLLGPPFFHDIYERFLFDNRLNLHWDAMTDAQRASSILDYNRVAWDGAQVTAKIPTRLVPPTADLKINTPAPNVPPYTPVGLAVFGPALTSPGVTGNLVVGLDASNAIGPTTTDGCTALTNAAAVAGKIAILDRGGVNCGFVLKVKNAQNAGAIAVVIADNVLGAPPGALGGADPTITIPAVRVTLQDGTALKAAANAGTVSATMGINPGLRRGADHLDRGLMYTPFPLVGGSSISHWDISHSPNSLMEPFINPDLTHDLDLTVPLFRDIGWAPDEDLDGIPDDQDQCAGSNLAASIVIDGCDSGVGNTLFTNGCTVSDLIAQIAAGAGNHGGFVSGVSHLTNELKKAGLISGAQKGAIQSCAAGAGIP